MGFVRPVFCCMEGNAPLVLVRDFPKPSVRRAALLNARSTDCILWEIPRTLFTALLQVPQAQCSAVKVAISKITLVFSPHFSL